MLAAADHCLVVVNAKQLTSKGGIHLADKTSQTPNYVGVIASVGPNVSDPGLKAGRVCYFDKSLAMQYLDEGGVERRERDYLIVPAPQDAIYATMTLEEARRREIVLPDEEHWKDVTRWEDDLRHSL